MAWSMPINKNGHKAARFHHVFGNRIPIFNIAIDRDSAQATFSTSSPIVTASLKALGQESDYISSLLVQAKGKPKREAEPVLGGPALREAA